MPYWRLFYHLIWATRDRLPLIDAEMWPELNELLVYVARKNEILIHAVGGIEDHVHLAVSIPPATSVASAVGRLKGSSSRELNRQPGVDFGWQTEYGVASFAERNLPKVVSYVTNQSLHHANNKLWPILEQIGTAATRGSDRENNRSSILDRP